MAGERDAERSNMRDGCGQIESAHDGVAALEPMSDTPDDDDSELLDMVRHKAAGGLQEPQTFLF